MFCYLSLCYVEMLAERSINSHQAESFRKCLQMFKYFNSLIECKDIVDFCPTKSILIRNGRINLLTYLNLLLFMRKLINQLVLSSTKVSENCTVLSHARKFYI